jgi:four helix bundle protein
MGVSRFEDLRVWQEAKLLSDEVGRLIRRPAIHQDLALRDQLNAAALSVMANIAEGFLRGRHKEFAQFIRIASGSNGEVRSLLHAAHGRGYLSDEERARLLGHTDRIGGMLRRLAQSLEPVRSTRH